MITIIVLLILAGISLNIVMGEDGIFNRAMNARKTSEIAGLKEQVELKVAEYSYDYMKQKYVNSNGAFAEDKATYISTKLGDNAREIEGCTVTGTSVKISKDGATVIGTIGEDGKVTWGQILKGTMVLAATDKSYVGYYIRKGGQYAIIYVDMLGQTVYTGGALQESTASVSVPSTSGKTFKTYTVTNTKYTNPNFGTNYVIEVAESLEGAEDRFIAMALTDVDENQHCWWNWFYSNCNWTGLGTDYDIGKGKTNTETVKNVWDANESGKNTGSYTDIWSLVTLDANNKTDWFIPSINEWIAFGAMKWTDNAETPVLRSILGGLSGNFESDFGLSSFGYWSSLQDHMSLTCARYADFLNGKQSASDVESTHVVRLSTSY